MSTQYSCDALFSKNHIKSNQIVDKIKQGKMNEILEGFIHIVDDSFVIEFKYFKHFASLQTYDLIVNYIDSLIVQLLLVYSETINVYINLQSLSLIDVEKHLNFFKYFSKLFSDKYPDKLNKCYIYNASMIFEAIFKMIRSFVDKETLDKIQLIKE